MAKKAASKASKVGVEKVEKAEKVEKPKKEAAAPKVKAEKKAPAKVKTLEEKAEAKKVAKEKKVQAAAAAAAHEANEKWLEMKDKHGKEKASKYSMTGQFQAHSPIEHPKLGWGYIINNNNDRLEVLFQEGVKILISNYNASAKI
ncbi:MAG: hypothetical protein ACK5P7_01710 [Bdellovibrio sp.]